MLPTKNKTYKKAFTLIELLLVIGILSVMSTIAFINFSGVQDRAQDAKRQTELGQYQNLLEVYASNNNNSYIASGTTSVTSLCGTTQLNMPNCPNDPDAPAKNYNYNGSTSAYVLWAELDLEDAGMTQYFVMCSNGLTGITTTQPSSSTCPL